MKLAGLGIDLVNVARMEAFVKAHPRKLLRRLLTPSEQKKILKRKISVLNFAKVFAAKEAFFKTLNASWLGLEGLSSLEVTLGLRDSFTIRPCGESFEKYENSITSGCFFRSGKLLGAQVVRWTE